MGVIIGVLLLIFVIAVFRCCCLGDRVLVIDGVGGIMGLALGKVWGGE